jgi:hypothetical protein
MTGWSDSVITFTISFSSKGSFFWNWALGNENGLSRVKPRVWSCTEYGARKDNMSMVVVPGSDLKTWRSKG